MSNRKLQTEIDRTLKKVTEGIELFSAIFTKIYTTTNQNQKEKYEQDLKKEIKKLQRLRDTLKGWIGSNEVKDKTQVIEARKNIESEMERFKACEKEMKLKQFSKEGLMMQDKLDPFQVKKADTCDWITAQVDAIATQIDALEAEAELIGQQRKVDRAGKDRLIKIDSIVAKHKFHTKKLEIALRMLENDDLTPEDIEDNIKEGVEYYVDSNQEPDFEEDDFLYDELNLIDEEPFSPVETAAVEEPKKTEKPKRRDEDKEKKDDKDDKETLKDKDKDKEKSIPRPNEDDKRNKPRQGDLIEENNKPMKASGPINSTPIKPAPITQRYSSVLGSSEPMEKTEPKKDPLPKQTETILVAPQPGLRNNHKIIVPIPSPILEDDIINEEWKSGADEISNNLKRGLEDLLASYSNATTKSYGTGDEILRNAQLNAMLESSYDTLPSPHDQMNPIPAAPKQPVPIPPHYPHTISPVFENSTMFEKFELDTLFFIFYYQQDSKQQLMAARELKKQSWRFHKKYLTWFQRHEEPKAITEEYEQGTYIYFDYEGAWCQRKKTEFTFEYRYLED